MHYLFYKACSYHEYHKENKVRSSDRETIFPQDPTAFFAFHFKHKDRERKKNIKAIFPFHHILFLFLSYANGGISMGQSTEHYKKPISLALRTLEAVMVRVTMTDLWWRGTTHIKPQESFIMTCSLLASFLARSVCVLITREIIWHPVNVFYFLVLTRNYTSLRPFLLPRRINL